MLPILLRTCAPPGRTPPPSDYLAARPLLLTTSPSQPELCSKVVLPILPRTCAPPGRTPPPSNYLAVSTRTVLESRVAHLASDVRPPRTHAPSNYLAVSTRTVFEIVLPILPRTCAPPGRTPLLLTTSPSQLELCSRVVLPILPRPCAPPGRTPPPSNYLAVSTNSVRNRVAHLASDVRPSRMHAPSF